MLGIQLVIYDEMNSAAPQISRLLPTIFRKTGCFDISEELQRSKLIHKGTEISLMTLEFY